MNLAVNARDAMPQGGRLRIQTANVVWDGDSLPRDPNIPPGRYVLLSVSDTGSGMTEEVKARAFEPFFTTKGLGKGTGLGLPMVQGIVKQSGGFVGVDSEPGCGTTVRLYFPAVERAAAPGSSPGSKVTPKGSETVLLVEDEASVRSLTRFVLQTHGYVVLEAADGEEAVQMVQRHRDPLHLVITDVVMPRMGGRQLVEQVRRAWPDVKVLYVSDHTDAAVAAHGVSEAEVAFLQKPYTAAALLRKVRELLDQPR